MSRRDIALPTSLGPIARGAGSIPSVVIVGRPNVGKSSLLNCLARQRIAIVDPTAGVTRDRISAVIEHNERLFELWDTGGIGTPDDLAAEVESQIDSALERADVVLFLVDAQQGLMPLDEEIGARLRRAAAAGAARGEQGRAPEARGGRGGVLHARLRRADLRQRAQRERPDRPAHRTREPAAGDPRAAVGAGPETRRRGPAERRQIHARQHPRRRAARDRQRHPRHDARRGGRALRAQRPHLRRRGHRRAEAPQPGRQLDRVLRSRPRVPRHPPLRRGAADD